MAEESGKTVEQATLPWGVLFKAAGVAVGAFIVAAVLIVLFAPSVYGPAAALRDWQTFLAGIFGFAGLIAGAVQASETRAREAERHRETLEHSTQQQRLKFEHEEARWEADRRALGGALLAEIIRLNQRLTSLAKAAAAPAKHKPFGQYPAIKPLLLPEYSSRLGLLKPELVTNLVAFFSYFENCEAERLAFGQDKLSKPDIPFAGICASTALGGLECIKHLVKVVKLSEDDAEGFLFLASFHTLPDNLLNAMSDPNGALKAFVNRIREVQNRKWPSVTIAPWV
ncbi:hypothetical protein [Shumkonia mesophila]|uniref:hypothetical protein n=1 Tax=Shumkonia mesophila TaxID=2838854 RepID=UPI002934AB09|nr:hypothetical protein [Shumkonia mesophila]